MVAPAGGGATGFQDTSIEGFTGLRLEYARPPGVATLDAFYQHRSYAAPPADEAGATVLLVPSEDVLREIITHVPGYAIPLPSLLIGRAVSTRPQGSLPPLEPPGLVFSARDTLFTSGTVSRFSWALNSVDEAKRPHGHIF